MFKEQLSFLDASPIWLFRICTLVTILLLSGCGYRSLLSIAATGSFSIIEVTGTSHSENFKFRLNSRLAPNAGGKYHLKVNLREKIIDLGIDPEAKAARVSFRLFAVYKIYDPGTNTLIKTGISDSATSYNYRPDAEITNRAAAITANVQNIDYLVDIIVQDLNTFFAINAPL